MTQTAQTAITPLQRLAKVLQLGTPSTYRSHTYVNGESLYFPTGRVYGGQVIAQAMMAASKTVSPSRLPNSIHGYFISAGDIRQDLLFDVENLRDGRSFSARRVNVTQAQGSILTAIASFQEQGQDGIEFADPMPEAAYGTICREVFVCQILCGKVAVRHSSCDAHDYVGCR